MFSFARPSLEIHIPLSPTPPFLRMLMCAVASLRHFGGAYRDAHVVAMFGDETHDRGAIESLPWIKRLGIECRWVPAERFAEDHYYATAIERFCQPFRSRIVLMLDADVLIARPLDPFIRGVHKRQVFQGLIAHVPPFGPEIWDRIYKAAGMGAPDHKHEHSGWGYMTTEPKYRYGPAYFNLGVLCAPAEYMSSIGGDVYDLMHIANSVRDSIYRCQVAVGLSVVKNRIPYEPLPMRYNFPNKMELEALHGSEFRHATILHVLGGNQDLTKAALYDDPEGVKKAIERTDLKATNAEIRRVLQAIHPTIERDLN